MGTGRENGGPVLLAALASSGMHLPTTLATRQTACLVSQDSPLQRCPSACLLGACRMCDKCGQCATAQIANALAT